LLLGGLFAPFLPLCLGSFLFACFQQFKLFRRQVSQPLRFRALALG
jgi:hypothetical protein